MELATAHDIKPCTALNQSTNYNHKILLQTLQRHARSVTHLYTIQKDFYVYVYHETSSNFLGLFSGT